MHEPQPIKTAMISPLHPKPTTPKADVRFGTAASPPARPSAQKPPPNKAEVIATVAKEGLLIFLYYMLPMPALRHWIEGKLIFHPHIADHPNNAERLKRTGVFQEAQLTDRFEEVRFNTEDNHNLYGWLIKPKPGKPTIVYSDGNAGSLWSTLKYTYLITQGYGFLAYNYRGYGNSKGTPSEEGFSKDLTAASDFLQHEKGIPVNEQIALGWSMGGGVTTSVAVKRPFKAVILESTFTKMQDVFESVLNKWNLPTWLRPLWFNVQQAFDSIGRIDQIKSPLLVLHGNRDSLVPFALGKKLFDATTNPRKQFQEFDGEDHLIEPHDTARAIDTFLKGL